MIASVIEFKIFAVKFISVVYDGVQLLDRTETVGENNTRFKAVYRT